MIDLADVIAQLCEETGLKFGGRTIINEQCQLITVSYRHSKENLLYIRAVGANIWVKPQSGNLERCVNLALPNSIDEIRRLFVSLMADVSSAPNIIEQIRTLRNEIRKYEYTNRNRSLIDKMLKATNQLLYDAYSLADQHNKPLPTASIEWFNPALYRA